MAAAVAGRDVVYEIDQPRVLEFKRATLEAHRDMEDASPRSVFVEGRLR